MPKNYLSAVQTAKYLTLSATGAAASAASLGAQLNQTHAFLYLQLPLWYFYVAMVVLSFIGAFWALATDTMQVRGNAISKVVTAITVGLVSSFIILPLVTEQPPVAVMMFVALAGSFSGTVLLYLLANVLGDDELRESVLKVIKDSIHTVIIDRIERLIAFLSGGKK